MKFTLLSFALLILTASQAQIITTVAGNGTNGNSGDGGPATLAQLNNPIGVVADNAGNIFITDFFNNTIRKVNSAGVITIFAGTGTLGYSGDGGAAVAATLYHPSNIIFDNAGNILFDDQNGEVIRKIDVSGIITTITGNLPAGYAGDGGQLLLAKFNGISDIMYDKAGNLFITDFGNNVIRKVNTSGIITTIAGNGTAGFSGDGGLATAAQLDAPYGVEVLGTGDILICDARNNRIRIVSTSGIINTYAGTGAIGYTGDGGPAISATFHWPSYSTMDNLGNLYVSDALNVVVRKIDNKGIITTYAGNGISGYSGDGGLATSAQMEDVCAIDYNDVSGNLYVVNRNLADVVRKVSNCLAAAITQQPANVTLCNAGNATFTIIASNATTYQWQVNTGTGWANLSINTVYAGVNSKLISITGATTAMNNYQYRCSLTNGCGAVLSTTAVLIVKTPAVPSINVAAPYNSICDGTMLTIVASIKNGGNSPLYQWKKNGLPAGTNYFSYSDNGLKNGDVISCNLTSSITDCLNSTTALSNLLVISVSNNVVPTVTIAASNNNICFGTPVTFSSVVANGGSTPSYAWFKNNVDLLINTPAYTDNLLNDGDIIMCSIRSSLTCVTLPQALSLPITIAVNKVLTPFINITASATKVCKATPILFTATTKNEGTAPVFQWRKNELFVGSNSNNYTDNNFADGDLISCWLTSTISTCRTSTSLPSNTLTIAIQPDPVVSLDKNYGLCKGSSRVLDAGNFSSYLWNNGSISRTIAVRSIGLYAVTVTDNNGCVGSGSANITSYFPLPSGFLPADTSICSYNDLLLKPNISFKSYLWNNGSNNPSISITQPGMYWLQVDDNNSCTGIDSIMVVAKECLRGFFMPTAFTPNNDGKNDLLKPLIFGTIKQYQFWIYNRFGQIVFRSTDFKKGWDGNFKGADQNGNVLAWMCVYQFEGETKQSKKGTVVLIR